MNIVFEKPAGTVIPLKSNTSMLTTSLKLANEATVAIGNNDIKNKLMTSLPSDWFPCSNHFDIIQVKPLKLVAIGNMMSNCL